MDAGLAQEVVVCHLVAAAGMPLAEAADNPLVEAAGVEVAVGSRSAAAVGSLLAEAAGNPHIAVVGVAAARGSPSLGAADRQQGIPCTVIAMAPDRSLSAAVAVARRRVKAGPESPSAGHIVVGLGESYWRRRGTSWSQRTCWRYSPLTCNDRSVRDAKVLDVSPGNLG